MKRLYLTAFELVPNEKGEERVKKANAKEELGEPEIGSKRWFAEQGIASPKGVEDEEEDEPEIDAITGFLKLKDDEVDTVETVVIVNLDEFSLAVDEDTFTTVWTKSGTYIKVLESAYEIDFQIDELNKNIFQKALGYIENLVYLCRRKLRKEEVPF